MQIIYSNSFESPKKIRSRNRTAPNSLHLVLIESNDTDLTICSRVEALVRLGGEPAISVAKVGIKLALAVVKRLSVLRKDVVVFSLATCWKQWRRGKRLSLGLNGRQGRHQGSNLERRQR